MQEEELRKFLDSGLLELYLIGALGSEEVSFVEKMRKLHPVVDSELAAIEAFLESDAIRNAVNPSAEMNAKMESIFGSFEKEQKRQLTALPLISAFSSADAWLEMIAPLLPKAQQQERFEKMLRHENGVTQVLVISSTDIEEEVHEDLDESFLILKGTCVCTIGSNSFNMGPGDFMQIPLYLPHTVRITSESVTAILQRVDSGV